MATDGLAFKQWAVNENVALSSSIEQIRDSRLGIDGEDYVHSLLISTPNREPLLPALGGLPFTLHKRIDEDLQGFGEAGIDPIFVFNGLDLACRDRASVLRESRKAANILGDAWSTYDNAKGEEAVNMFGRACTYRSYHIVRSVQVYLHRQGAKTQTAPYSAASQLAYLERQKFVDAVCGSASCLMFGSERVITRFDWDNPSFLWVGLEKCFTKLALSRDQFINLCLLSGSSILPPLPEVDTDSPKSKMQAARGVMSRAGNDINTVLNDTKDDNYRILFHKARYALKHPVVITMDGKVEHQNWESGPSDSHEFTGQRLPEEMYFYLSRGVIGPRVLNWRTRAETLETPPLDGGNSQAYKDLVQDELLPLRSQALALMTHSLNRYYQKHDVELACWWDERSKTPLNIPDQTTATKSAESWHVKTEQMAKTGGVNVEGAPLWSAVSSLSKDSDAKKTVTPHSTGSGDQMHNLEDIRANVVWRFLSDRGYINPDHTLSPWGKSLNAAFNRAIDDEITKTTSSWAEIEEAIFMAFELVRLDFLGTENMFPVPGYSGPPTRGSDTDKGNNLLISRIACLGTFQHAQIGYTGPLSRHLLAFHQSAATVRGALRDLMEMHTCNMLLSGVVDRTLTNTAYTDLGASLPFVDEPDLGLGLIVKSYLDELSSESSKRQDISKWLPHALDIKGDLEKAWKLWSAVNVGVQAAESIIINSETKTIFKNANEWLAQKREQVNAPNGTA